MDNKFSVTTMRCRCVASDTASLLLQHVERLERLAHNQVSVKQQLHEMRITVGALRDAVDEHRQYRLEFARALYHDHQRATLAPLGLGDPLDGQIALAPARGAAGKKAKGKKRKRK